MTAAHAERFWAKVRVAGDMECWVWQGATSSSGHGRFVLDGKNRQAHRVGWALTTGVEPEGMVLHHCDNPPCVNPQHLYVGSRADNTRDMISRDRRPSVLPASQRREIRRRFEPRFEARWRSNAKELAEEFGVTPHYIKQTVQRGRL